jgi:hypothetical protein
MSSSIGYLTVFHLPADARCSNIMWCFIDIVEHYVVLHRHSCLIVFQVQSICMCKFKSGQIMFLSKWK